MILPTGRTLSYTMPLMHCRHRRHECDGGISADFYFLFSVALSSHGCARWSDCTVPVLVVTLIRAFPVAAVRVEQSTATCCLGFITFFFCSRLKSHFFSLLLIIYVTCLRSDTVILDMLVVRTYLLTYLAHVHCWCSRPGLSHCHLSYHRQQQVNQQQQRKLPSYRITLNSRRIPAPTIHRPRTNPRRTLLPKIKHSLPRKRGKASPVSYTHLTLPTILRV